MAITTDFPTWGTIWAKLKSELDIEDDDDFIDDTEAMGYGNDAVDEVEAEICTIYEDYFLKKSLITLVNGTDTYDLPSTIYAHKIRGVVYFNGSNIYEVKRIRDFKKFLEYRMARYNSSSTEDYSYFIENGTAGDPQFLLSPPAYEAGARIEIWHVRQANRFEDDDDVCDIPEFYSFVVDFVRERVEYKRAAGSPRHASAKQKLDEQRQRMIDTLTAMVPDGNNEVEADTSSYDDMN